MYGLDAYRQQKTSTISRVDLLLMAYDGIIDRLEKAKEFWKQKNELQAMALMTRCQAIIVELMAGLDLSHGDVPRKTQALYIFVMQRIGLGDEIDLDAALKITRLLRQGIQDVREDAVEAENAGQIPSIDRVRTVSTSG